MSLEWQEKILQMVEENFSTPDEPKVVALDGELPESFELESPDLRHISMLDEYDLKIFNELRSLEELKMRYEDVPNHANLVDAVIKNMREKLVMPGKFAAARECMMSPEERQKELEEFIEKHLNDKRFLPLERSNMGLQFKLLSVYDEAKTWLIRCAYEDGPQMIKEYGCQCKAILCDTKPDATLLHIAVEHVGKPTSLKILFQAVIKLSKKTGKDETYCCIACKTTETDQSEFLAHFWNDKCCNVNYLEDGSIDMERIQKHRLSVLIDFVSKILHHTLDTKINDTELCEILQVSSVTLSDQNRAELKILVEESHEELCPRCRRFSVTSNAICNRCENVLNTKKN